MNLEGKSWRELTDEVEFLEGLLASPGWKVFLHYWLQDREMTLAGINDTPMKSTEDCLAAEFVKGRCYQGKITPQFVKDVIDSLRTTINDLQQSEEQDDDSSRDSDPDGNSGSGSDE